VTFFVLRNSRKLVFEELLKTKKQSTWWVNLFFQDDVCGTRRRQNHLEYRLEKAAQKCCFFCLEQREKAYFKRVSELKL
jgi:hypothetical protein